MSNGSEACCAIGICCPPASAERVTALAKILTDNTSGHALTAQEAAACVLEHFDLAIKGTLQPLIDSVVFLSKHAKT
jgi:hypothetical protein